MGGRRKMERSWDELGLDCLMNVFEKLEIEDLTFGVPLVCKSWYRASLNPLCWKSIDLSKLSFSPDSRFAQRFNHEYRIHNFSLSSFMKFALHRGGNSVIELLLPRICTIQSLIHASSQCPRLKILGLPVILIKRDDGLPGILIKRDEEMKQFFGLFTKWKELEYLHIRREIQFHNKDVLFEVSRHCKNFVGLNRRGPMGDDEAVAIANLLPTLKHLTITSASLSRENLKIILAGCKELEDLVVKKCWEFKIDEEIMKMTSHIKNFKYEE